MKMRSTGLGETVLEGKLNQITRKDDYLILHVNTTEPVEWHVRAAIDYGDLLTLVKLVLKGPVLRFIVSGFKNRKQPRHTDDF